jgi:hypothetical protein
MSIFKKATLATALVATALAGSSPAMARGYHRGGDDTAAWAIGAGIIGLAVGAAVASSNHHHRDYDDGYYNNGGYYGGFQYRDGYYWDHDGRRYDRYEYERWCRDHGGYNQGSYGGYNGYDGDYRRGYDRDYYQRRGW